MKQSAMAEPDKHTGTGPEGNSGKAGSPDAQVRRWLLKYGERIYGPYTPEAMEGYIAEGRVAAHSLIAPEGTLPGSDLWSAASGVEPFVKFFTHEAVPRAMSPAATEPSAHNTERPPYGPGKGQIDRRRQPATSNFLIVMDIKARYAGALEQAIMSLGPAYKLAPNVWCVNTNATAAGLLNDLSQHIGKSDSMFIVDATRDRTAWCNLGPEIDAKIRRVWRRPF
jgi:hypothetical protein